MYNLGVVDNKQSPAQGQQPDNENTNEWEFPSFGDKDWEKILGTVLLMIGIIFIVIMFAPLLPVRISFVVWLLMLPFKLIGAIIKGIANAIKKAATKKPKTTSNSPIKTVKAPQSKTVYVKSNKAKYNEKQNK